MIATLSRVQLIALAGAGSAALLAGAFAFQHLGGLAPCAMCLWQRWPHATAIAIAAIAALAATTLGAARPLATSAAAQPHGTQGAGQPHETQGAGQPAMTQRAAHPASPGGTARALPGLAALGAVAMLVNAGIALYHTGVERAWWQGPTSCSGGGGGGISDMTVTDLLNPDIGTGIVMCDEVAWSLFGLSMASWNGLACLALALVWALAARSRPA